MNKNFQLFFGSRGMSLVELLVAIAILGIVVSGLTSFMLTQQKETRAVQESLARLDIEKTLINALADGTICTAELTNLSLNSAAPYVIDTTNLSQISIGLQQLHSRASTGAPILLQVGASPSALASSLQISNITLYKFASTGLSDQFVAYIEIKYASKPLVRALRSSAFQVLVQTDPTTPDTAKKITGCSWGAPQTLTGVLSNEATLSNFNAPVQTNLGIHKFCFLTRVVTVQQIQACECSVISSGPGWQLFGGADATVPNGHCTCAARCMD